MKHDIDIAMAWCRRCGRPAYEIIDLNLVACDGLKGVIHKRFLVAKADFERIMNPVVEKLLEEMFKKPPGE